MKIVWIGTSNGTKIIKFHWERREDDSLGWKLNLLTYLAELTVQRYAILSVTE